MVASRLGGGGRAGMQRDYVSAGRLGGRLGDWDIRRLGLGGCEAGREAGVQERRRL